MRQAAGLLPASTADNDRLVLKVPADGTVDSLRQLLDGLHQEGIVAERVSIHTSDLDDVFLAVTGSHVVHGLEAGGSDAESTQEGVTSR